ncbi:VOC family protein [Aquimarina sp. RZ0]|uniref:VOC family protein n=1 Tax=Aquimarina sp. RZ0 TaxID=2607730 RepID=UPI0011F30D9A|nr:VOC family protein [Aquimarina sp. RZ0]KAA1244928.1 VOC family protein [Aquimarina sp. RZ0]
MSLLYKRVTLCVADLERSLKVYRDILGFTINYIQSSEKDSFSYPVFNIPNEADLTFATMDSPSQERTFALTEIKGVSLPKQEGIHMVASVIKVDNLVSVIKKIKALGLKTTDVKTDENEYATFIEQAFVDFDGHLIVLYELIDK